MATKLTNTEASYFIRIFNGESKEKIINTFELLKQYRLAGNSTDATEFIKGLEASYATAKTLYDSIKLFDEPEAYSMNAWGYEQTNYENITVIGTFKNAVIALGDYTVYSISKNKYSEREYAELDSKGVRSTNWKEPYSLDEISEQRQNNLYWGH